MPTADVQLSFTADASSLQDSLQPLQDALATLQASFADTSAVEGWSQAVGAAADSAASAVGSAAQTMQDALTTRLDPIGAGVSKMFTGLITGSETFGQGFEKLGEQMLSRFVGWTAQMAEQWAVGELTQTAASTSGAAARTAVATSAQASGLAASGAEALADIANSAARAAAGAYAAVASTPIVGPALAPAAAATALAAALEFGGQVVSAAGGWGQVPYDGALASLHKDEMVLPSSIASPLRSAVGGAEPGAGGAGRRAWRPRERWRRRRRDPPPLEHPGGGRGELRAHGEVEPGGDHRRADVGLAAAVADARQARRARKMSSSYPYLPMRWLVTTPDLADDPDVFPRLPGQGFLEEKTPVWSTTVRTSASGRQVRASQCATPTWRFKVGYEFIRDRITSAELAKLYGFFNTRQGQLGSFYYYDPNDNLVAGQQVAVADGVTTTYQLTRTVSPGTPYAFVEPVYVLNGNPSVSVAGVRATGFAVGEYGQIVFSAPPPEGSAISWSGSFLYWCRFSQDTVSPAQMVASLWSLDGLQFESVKP